MIIRRYNIELEKFHPGILKYALELRNKEFVRKNMVYSQQITWEEHVRWFNGLNPEENFYFLIRVHGEPIGVMNIKDLDVNTNMAELGIFIGEQEMLNTPFPFLCCLMLADIAVKLFKLQPFNKVKDGADDIVSLNHSLGFELHKQFDGFVINYLNKSLHYKLTSKVRKAADVLYPGNPIHKFNILIDKEDTKDLGVEKILRLYRDLSEEDKALFELTRAE